MGLHTAYRNNMEMEEWFRKGLLGGRYGLRSFPFD
jgi:hypothetical protein